MSHLIASERRAVAAVQQILMQLYRLVDDGVPEKRIIKLCRETVFFLYEVRSLSKFDPERPHSAGARALHRDAIAARRKFSSPTYPIVYDHAIPLLTLRQGLRSAALGSIGELTAFLKQHIWGVVVLKEEDDRLSKAGLRGRMPAGAALDDPMARYRAVGISFEADDLAKFQQASPRLSGGGRT
jgi:hypothetical protein